jgi:DNA-binding transcriptional regulator YiaG
MKKMGRPVEIPTAENIVAETRRKLNIGQREFAAMLGLTPGAISHFETSKRKIHGPVERLCKLIQKHGADILLTLNG